MLAAAAGAVTFANATGSGASSSGVVPAGAAGQALVSADVADEDDMCIICLTNKRQIGFLHGSSVHRCVCKECAGLVAIGGPCPLCRAPISAVLAVY